MPMMTLDRERTDEAALLALAKERDRGAFQQLTDRYRRELQVHCYRMLGSFHDAEDLVQETFLRAWRSVPSFDGRASMRHWLYRIATNACLNALASRARLGRVLPESQSPPTTQMPSREPASEIGWLEPYPDCALDGVADGAPGPEARYATREAVHLAFIAAIQLLPPRQRATLLLTDVLGWSARDSARLLGSSVAAVNSALQRARATLDERLPGGPPQCSLSPGETQRALLDRYVRAWETMDVDVFTALLKDDAVMSMPPWREWYHGRPAIATFFARTGRPGGHAPFRLVPTAANREPAFAFYSRWQSPEWRFHSIQVVVVDGSRIEKLTSFVMPALASAFDLPDVLADT
jgi:RNA polymerase sigma-70 factor (ECF subfamily)